MAHAAPENSTASLTTAPCNERGDELWSSAETRRAQGQWSEALEFYRRHRAKYSISNAGCPAGSTSFETMVLAESACLENLGRYDKAVELLWPVVWQLPNNLPPRALRHLVDLYLTTGQIAVLRTAAAQEKTPRLDRKLAYSNFSSIERVRHCRKAARERRWKVLLASLHYSENEHYESELRRDIAFWNRREAIVALSLMADEAAPILERALAKKQNPYFRAAWLACVPLEQRQSWLEQLQNVLEAQTIFDAAIREDLFVLTPIVFPKPPASLRLPAELPYP